MPPTSKKLKVGRGGIASGAFVRLSFHPSHFLMHSITVHATVLKFLILVWIPEEKIADMYIFS